jgi:hypothetical protein
MREPDHVGLAKWFCLLYGGFAMKRALILFAVVMMFAGVAYAQVHYEFHCAGTGNMVKDSPVVYTGPIDGGDLSPGTWSIQVTDDTWPPVGDDAVRWDYIFATYYTYDMGNGIWTGTVDNNSLYLEKDFTGTMLGVCDLTFQIIDFDGDGIVDPEECMDGLSGAVIIIREGTGAYAQLCGQGTYEGFYFRDCDTGSETYMLDNVDFTMQLDLQDCGMATSPSTWSAIKSLFE